ncbi:MAG: hypothetical protein K0S28_1690 [Paucimonas sp.]|jgi:LPS-assembly lipoprotein|nr:hypothetical protein [Paucimonas sp.]
MQMTMRLGWLAIAGAMTLSACGFHLRGSDGSTTLPFRSVFLALPDNSQLGTEMRRYIRASGETTIVADAASAEAIIEPLAETREKVIRSRNAQGLIREYTLLYRFKFRVKDSKNAELVPPTEIELKRDISYNESQAIAKEKEEEMLYRDMQSDLVQQILRRLASLKPSAA